MYNIKIENADYIYNKIDNIYTINNFTITSKIIIENLIDGNIVFNITENAINKLILNNNNKEIILDTIENTCILNKNQKIEIKMFSDINNINFNIEKINSYIINNINIILITTKIYVSDNPFTYTKTRSIYTTSDRFNQTLNTIESIKKYIPDYFIVLFDNSKFTLHEINILKKNVNLLINIQNNKIINYFTDINDNKAYGELIQTLYSLKIIKNIPFKHFFKISGRYILNNTFKYNIYNNDENIFKKNKDVTHDEYYYTCFYKISNTKFKKFFNNIMSLHNIIKNSDIFNSISYEIFMPKNINKTEINNLGITQNISVYNDITEI